MIQCNVYVCVQARNVICILVPFRFDLQLFHSLNLEFGNIEVSVSCVTQYCTWTVELSKNMFAARAEC